MSSSSNDSSSSDNGSPSRDELSHLRSLTLEKPVLLFPGREGTEVYALPMKIVRSLPLGAEVVDQKDFLE